MEKQIFTISNISCGHCVATIQKELQELEGVADVEGNPQTKTIIVEWQAPVSDLKLRPGWLKLAIRCPHRI